MHLACVVLLALAQGQFGKDTKGAEPTTHDKPAVSQPESRADTPNSTASNTSDKAETLSPVHQTDRPLLLGRDRSRRDAMRQPSVQVTRSHAAASGTPSWPSRP